MPRRPALFTKTDVARAIRAAKEENAAAVVVKPDGSIVVQLKSCEQVEETIASDEEIVL